MAQSASRGIINHSLSTFIKMAWLTKICFVAPFKEREYEKIGWNEENIQKTYWFLLIYFITFFYSWHSFDWKKKSIKMLSNEHGLL